MSERTRQKTLHSHVEFLSSISPPRNYVNVASLNRVAQYIRKEFEKSGLEVREQEFEVEGQTYRNLITDVGPKDGPKDGPKRWVVGAHYDVFGEYPGADDNASGVAGLLELARLLKLQESGLFLKIC